MYKVIRIEDPYERSDDYSNINQGAYGRTNIIDYIRSEGCVDDSVSPSPLADPKLSGIWKGLLSERKSSGWFFGFEDVESMKRWFFEENLLVKHQDKYVVVEYEVLERHVGTSQCIFLATSVVKRTVMENPWA